MYITFQQAQQPPVLGKTFRISRYVKRSKRNVKLFPFRDESEILLILRNDLIEALTTR